MTFHEPSSRTPVAERPADDVTLPAFQAAVESDDFWAMVEAGRAAGSIEQQLQVSADYRRHRAERAVADLRG